MPKHKAPLRFSSDFIGKGSTTVDVALAPFLKEPSSFNAPKTITDKICKRYYKQHLSLLSKLHILSYSDLPELTMMYETLEQYRKVNSKLQELDPVSKEYGNLSRLAMKLSKHFTELAHHYYLSPVARNKMLIDVLDIQGKKEKSIIGSLIDRKEN
jgi:phage terminase small subunit